MSRAERNEMWPEGKRRRHLGGRTSVGIIELTVEMLAENGSTPAMDIYEEVRANGVACSYDYVVNLRSLVASIMIEMNKQGLTKKKLIPDK